MKQRLLANKVIIVAGPTASGKTDFAIKLAQEFNGELINADSRQIYNGLDIGTNKGILTATNEHAFVAGKDFQAYELEHSGILGWMFNFLNPNERFTVSEFYDFALALIDLITASGKLPIIVGGTGLYIDALLKNYRMGEVLPNEALRKELSTLSAGELFARLEKVDLAKANSLNNSDKHNPRRLMRAIEIAESQNVSRSEANPANTQIPNNEYLMFYPEISKEELYAKIDKRVPEMYSGGIISETKVAILQGFEATEILNGIGYIDVKKLLKNEISEAEAISATQQGHRNYAKRQITWFEGAGRAYDLHKLNFKSDFVQATDQVADFLQK